MPKPIGTENGPSTIAAAEANATEAEAYIVGDLALHLGEHLRQADPKTTTVVVDPPATGLAGDVREVLRRNSPRMLLYVSCNSPTLARDLAHLGLTFTLESVTPFDMFPQTAEIEVLAHLTGHSNR